MTAISLKLRPAPAAPAMPPDAPPHLKQWQESIVRWCRDAEKAIREMEVAVNALIEAAP